MYNDSHRYFIQYMLSHPCIKLEYALEIFKKCSNEEEATFDHLKSFIVQINKIITEQDFKIVSSRCEISGQHYLIFINTSNDEVTKLQVDYTPVQIEYFQAVVKEILSSEEKRVSPIFCLNLSSTMKTNFTRHNAEICLQKWTAESYFAMNDNFVYLGPRYISEFTSYLKSSCEDFVSTCMLCSEVLVLGTTCRSCKKHIHNYCLERFFRTQKKCPDCKKPWNTVEESIPNSSQDVLSQDDSSQLSQEEMSVSEDED